MKDRTWAHLDSVHVTMRVCEMQSLLQNRVGPQVSHPLRSFPFGYVHQDVVEVLQLFAPIFRPVGIFDHAPILTQHAKIECAVHLRLGIDYSQCLSGGVLNVP